MGSQIIILRVSSLYPSKLSVYFVLLVVTDYPESPAESDLKVYCFVEKVNLSFVALLTEDAKTHTPALTEMGLVLLILWGGCCKTSSSIRLFCEGTEVVHGIAFVCHIYSLTKLYIR